MHNAKINETFLAATDGKTKSDVLGAIAKHYGISPQDAYSEVVNAEAEHLLDYLSGSTRAAVSVLMQRHCAAA